MKIASLDNLNKDSNGLYDLTKDSYKLDQDILDRYDNFIFIVTKDEEMRIDLVCNAIYGNTDYCDLLLILNGISNPMIIKDGIEIRYVPLEEINALKITGDDADQIIKKISDSRSKTRIDQKRERYKDSKSSLPPTVKSAPSKAVQLKDGKVTIGDNIFGN